ncbi:hypothetical protein LY76DRAFT_337961 [Colletotrichum caudatum]|nr:hypothetical protein LY76DRAFT_337961 [Colletotrichum caudatum]
MSFAPLRAPIFQNLPIQSVTCLAQSNPFPVPHSSLTHKGDPSFRMLCAPTKQHMKSQKEFNKIIQSIAANVQLRRFAPFVSFSELYP